MIIIGPGTYQSNRMEIAHKISDKRSPVFKSKEKRFDSKLIKQSTVQPEKTEMKLSEKKFSILMVRKSSQRHNKSFKRTVPSIPCKRFSYF